MIDLGYAQTQDGNAQYQVETALFEPKGKVEGDWYDRGIKGVQANSYRKGACENCGAMGHHKKECTERPRKLTAKHNNKNIAPDDVIKNLELKWDAKRDRWNGYEADRYKEIIEEFEKTEEIRKKVKLSDGTEDPNSEYKSEVDLIALADLPSKHQKNQKFQGLTGLRNREDRAKYLLNLDPNVQDFNPKSRTMNSEDSYADELTRMQIMGEKYDLIEQDKFAFEQVEKHHAELSSAALPTITEKIYKSVKQKR